MYNAENGLSTSEIIVLIKVKNFVNKSSFYRVFFIDIFHQKSKNGSNETFCQLMGYTLQRMYEMCLPLQSSDINEFSVE